MKGEMLMKRILSFAMAFFLSFSLLPTVAFAEGEGLALGMPEITKNLTDNKGTVVGFDSQEWYVIGDYETGVNPLPSNLTLLHKLDVHNQSSSLRYGASPYREVAYLPPLNGEYPKFRDVIGQRFALYTDANGDVVHVRDSATGEVFPEVVYFDVNFDAPLTDPGYDSPNDYYGCTMQQHLDFVGEYIVFDRESALITPRTLTSQNDDIAGKDVSNQKLWNLSKVESESCRGAANHYFAGATWLRSPGTDSLGEIAPDLVQYYYSGGNYGFTNSERIYSEHGTKQGNVFKPDQDLITPIRPAFNLNVENVLFATSAGGEHGKSQDVRRMKDFNSLQAGRDLRKDGDPIKFTMADKEKQTLNIDNPNATVTVTDGKGVVNYSNAATGVNQYISCVITSNDGNNILYYAKLVDCLRDGSASGEITIGVPNELLDGTYSMYLFSEQDNGANSTDFAGQRIQLNFDKIETHTVTYHDGLDGEVFEPESYSGLRVGDPTPKFKGNTERHGFRFDGWYPEWSETVTGSVTHVAKWTYVGTGDADGGKDPAKPAPIAGATTPKTGDSINFALLASVLLLSGITLVGAAHFIQTKRD